MIPISRRLLFITLIESFATAIVENGIFFYADDQLNFTNQQNLFMAVLFGVMYVIGAFASHPLSKRISEKQLLIIVTLAQMLGHALLACELGGASTLITLNTTVALMTGLKWPLIESYVSAGHTPVRASRAVGFFNLSWSSAVVPAVACSGLLIDTWSPGLFVLPAAINLATLVMLKALATRPGHLEHDHPERPSAKLLTRYRALLTSSRWTMMSSYMLLFLLVPLMPNIFKNLGFTVAAATALAGLLHLMRTMTFFALERHAWWHGRADILIFATLCLPLGCIMVLFTDHVAWVVVGEIIFGIATGLTYYAALYYAMVVGNASVDASATHEGLIGIGFVLGPLIGLSGVGLGQWIDSQVMGMLLALAPMFAIGIAGALGPLVKLRRHA